MAQKMVVEICLYGTMQIGHGYLAMAPEGMKVEGGKAVRGGTMFGDGAPHPNRTCTEAVWLACQELIEAGVPRKALAVVYVPSGERCAVAPLGNMPAFGDLKFQPAPMLTLSIEALLAAEEG